MFYIFHDILPFEIRKLVSTSQEGFYIFLALRNVTVNLFGFQPHKDVVSYAFVIGSKDSFTKY